MSDEKVAAIQGKRIAKLEDGLAEVKTDLAVGSEMFRQIRKEVGELVEEDRQIHGQMQTSLNDLGKSMVRVATIVEGVESRLAAQEARLQDHIEAEHPHPNVVSPPPPLVSSEGEVNHPPSIIPRGKAERALALILQYGGKEAILIVGILGGMWLLNQWGIIGV